MDMTWGEGGGRGTCFFGGCLFVLKQGSPHGHHGLNPGAVALSLSALTHLPKLLYGQESDNEPACGLHRSYCPYAHVGCVPLRLLLDVQYVVVLEVGTANVYKDA